MSNKRSDLRIPAADGALNGAFGNGHDAAKTPMGGGFANA